MLHPVGTLRVSQRLVPLDLTLDKFGNQQPSDANRFALTVTAGGLGKVGNLQEQFAPAQFRNIDDADKLSQPAYVPQDSGIELAVTGITYASGTAITRTVRYDVTIIDTKLLRAFSQASSCSPARFSAISCAAPASRAASFRPSARRRPIRSAIPSRSRPRHSSSRSSPTTRCSVPTPPPSPARRPPTTTSPARWPAIPTLARHAARPAAIRDGRMSTLGTYSFLPWLRQGIANTIASADSDPSVKTRARACTSSCSSPAIRSAAATELTAPLPQDIALYGPGDIVGIDARAIVRTDPRPWITNFESNYLAAVEFYDEDFPVALHAGGARTARGCKLRPWLTLIVLQETEFSEDQGVGRGRCRASRSRNRAALPPADELWAWAHVHFNQSLAGSDAEHVSPDMGAVLPRVQAIIGQNPDLAYSRLVCPRRLDDNTGYHAFVVPTFETGRLAGLGKDPTARAARHLFGVGPGLCRASPSRRSCRSITAGISGPDRKGDFEYLVTLLKPQPVDTRSARATWTCRTRARTFPASPIRRSAACCGSAARCRCPTPISTRSELADPAEVRELGPALSAPVPDGARHLHQPARRLCGADRCRRQCRHGHRRASPTIPIR